MNPLLSAVALLGDAPARALTPPATVAQLTAGRRQRYLASLCECGVDRLACERESVSDGDDQRHAERLELLSEQTEEAKHDREMVRRDAVACGFGINGADCFACEIAARSAVSL